MLPSSYARILSWVAFIVLPSSLQPRLLPYFPLVHVACKFVACFFDYTYVWNLCSHHYDFKKKLVINEIVTYKNILFSLADDLDNAGIATYATQRIHESGVRCGLLLTNIFYLPASFLLLDSFALGEKNFSRQSARFWEFVCIMISG